MMIYPESTESSKKNYKLWVRLQTKPSTLETFHSSDYKQDTAKIEDCKSNFNHISKKRNRGQIQAGLSKKCSFQPLPSWSKIGEKFDLQKPSSSNAGRLIQFICEFLSISQLVKALGLE